MKIVVLAGGLSPERDVSLSSGSLIANALIENGHKVLLLDLFTGLEDASAGDSLFIGREQPQRYHYQVPEQEPDLCALRAQGHGNRLIGRHVLALCERADLVFLALHGSIGENGQLQAVLDTHGIPYTGTGYAGSMLAMDKHIAKLLMQSAGIPTPPWQLIDTRKPLSEELKIPYPCFVKPCGCGSSVGVTRVENPGGLAAALEAARAYEPVVLVETLIEGREFSVGILDGAPLPVIEIVPRQGFYDYANKYQPGLTQEICPALLNSQTTQELQQAAAAVHRVLRLGYYSRIDFMQDARGGIHCLEANTLPGMTPTSLLPQEAQAAGISYRELCEQIALSALSPGSR